MHHPDAVADRVAGEAMRTGCPTWIRPSSGGYSP